MLQAQSNEGTSIVWLSSFQLSRVNSPDDSSEKMSPRVRVRVSLEFASKGPFNVCLKLSRFHFQYDAHLEFRFPERREEQ